MHPVPSNHGSVPEARRHRNRLLCPYRADVVVLDRRRSAACTLAAAALRAAARGPAEVRRGLRPPLPAAGAGRPARRWCRRRGRRRAGRRRHEHRHRPAGAGRERRHVADPHDRAADRRRSTERRPDLRRGRPRRRPGRAAERPGQRLRHRRGRLHRHQRPRGRGRADGLRLVLEQRPRRGTRGRLRPRDRRRAAQGRGARLLPDADPARLAPPTSRSATASSPSATRSASTAR